MAGAATRAAIHSQPDWLRQVPTDRRLPDGARVVYSGCGTSFHAAQTGGEAVQALEAVLRAPDADLLVVISHEGDTPLSLEAARAFPGPKWLVTGKPDSPLGELADEVIVATPEIEQSWCHTVSYTCAVAPLAALRGEAIDWLPDAVAAALEDREPLSDHERWLVAGAGRDWPTAQEAVLKLREGVFVAAASCSRARGARRNGRKAPQTRCASSAATSRSCRRGTRSSTSSASSSSRSSSPRRAA